MLPNISEIYPDIDELLLYYFAAYADLTPEEQACILEPNQIDFTVLDSGSNNPEVTLDQIANSSILYGDLDPIKPTVAAYSSKKSDRKINLKQAFNEQFSILFADDGNKEPTMLTPAEIQQKLDEHFSRPEPEDLFEMWQKKRGDVAEKQIDVPVENATPEDQLENISNSLASLQLSIDGPVSLSRGRQPLAASTPTGHRSVDHQTSREQRSQRRRRQESYKEFSERINRRHRL